MGGELVCETKQLVQFKDSTIYMVLMLPCYCRKHPDSCQSIGWQPLDIWHRNWPSQAV